MTELSFAGLAAQTDRRRRLLTGEPADSVEPVDSLTPAVPQQDLSLVAFASLSRDQLIRRVFSPRAWKHAAAAAALIAVPLLLEIALLRGSLGDAGSGPDRSQAFSRSLRAITGLELFVSAQIALLISWVRACSTVDFRGRFRSWQWTSAVLALMSVVLLTDTWQFATDQLAGLLQPLLGNLNAARPALLLVPVVAVLAFILKSLIPDLGRCRPAQALLVAGILCAVVRLWPGLDRVVSAGTLHMSVLELLAGTLILSAFQLHGRFVIHVNPHPPAPRRKPKPVAADRGKRTAAQTPVEQNPESGTTPELVPLPAVASVEPHNSAADALPEEMPAAPGPADRTSAKSGTKAKGAAKSRRRAG